MDCQKLIEGTRYCVLATVMVWLGDECLVAGLGLQSATHWRGIQLLTEITAVIETIRAASITDALFTLFELLEESKVTWDCGGVYSQVKSGFVA